ncbi:MAG: hypothetical protein IID46_08750 [Planctomycetes bacterium]|nr:hypothetical protein [Planctomycetota bacterium]
MFLKKWVICFTVFGGLLVCGKSATAQGLIWKLPQDGTWVEFEGKYSQTDFRPNSPDGDLEPAPWSRRLRISSVGQQMAEFNGTMQLCRWIELEVRTGRSDGGVIDTGPAGARIYKVLVPESKIINSTTDGDGIPISMIPIVKGYQKIGIGDTKPIPLNNNKSGVLQIYPVISLLRHYKTLESLSDQPEDAGINIPDITARRYRSQKTMESPTSRSTHTAVLWRSPDMPFGVARWTVKILREEKGSTEPRSAFKKVSEFSIEMKAGKIEGNAQSKIAEQ